MMNFSYILRGIGLFILFLFSCCTDKNEILSDETTKVRVSIDEFQPENNSRTNINLNEGTITWASGDIIGIFPFEGYQEPFTIPTNQVGKSNAVFDGGYWALKNGLNYNAYYPFDKKNFESAEMKTQIPVTYIGQEQVGSQCSIGAYDYSYSDWKEATAEQTINFTFHHIGAIVQFNLEYPKTSDYTLLTLTADDKVIPTYGTYDLTAEDVKFKANDDSYTNSISLSLKNHSGTEGETGTFYMMLPPMDLSNNQLIVSLTSSTGGVYTYSIPQIKEIKEAKYYIRTGERMGYLLPGGWLFSTLVSWELNDNISRIKFVTNSEQTSEISLGSDENNTDAYIVLNNECLEIHTIGDEFVANEDCSGMFGGYSGDTDAAIFGNITEIDFGEHFNTQSVTTMYAMFAGCQSLSIIDFSNFNTENVTEMLSMFENCESLTQLDLSSFNTENLTDMCMMFEGCKGLSQLNLSSFNTENVLDMSYMFEGCKSLMELDLSNFIINENTDFEGMFNEVGEDAIIKPISIFISSYGKNILENAETGINEDYAKFVIK